MLHHRRFLSLLRDSAKSFYRRVGAWRRFIPLSLAGFLLLTLSGLTLFFIAQPGHDLVLSVICYGFVGLASILLFILLTASFVLRRTLSVQAYIGVEKPVARIPVPIALRINAFRVPPLFSLRISLIPTQPGPTIDQVVITGASNPERLLVVNTEARFPHRGFWNIESAELTLRDAVGITRWSWQFPLNATCEVHPAALSIQPLPIAAESSRSGELSQYSRERTGDPFDMKAYDPSDGIRRVLWKTFARSGELYVRRPEPAIVPEGELPIFVIAKPEQDEVAAAALCFIEQLEREEIVSMLGTDGLTSDSEHKPYVIGLESAGDSLNRFAMHPEAGTGKDIERFLSGLESDGKLISRVVVFGSSLDTDWSIRAAAALAAHGLQASLVTVPANLREFAPMTVTMPDTIQFWHFVRSIFPIFPTAQTKAKVNADFMHHSTSAGVQFLECELQK